MRFVNRFNEEIEQPTPDRNKALFVYWTKKALNDLIHIDDITSNELIRVICLTGINQYSKISGLYGKIKKGHEFKGLYPHIMKTYNIIPE